MKFSQMEYERPDVDGMIEQYKQITERFPNCKNAKEQMKCILEHESIMKTYQTMSTLAYIHNSINTADEFYAQEKAFYNEKSPVIQEYEQAFLQVASSTPCGQRYLQKNGFPIPSEFVTRRGSKITKINNTPYFI